MHYIFLVIILFCFRVYFFPMSFYCGYCCCFFDFGILLIAVCCMLFFLAFVSSSSIKYSANYVEYNANNQDFINCL